MSGISIEFHSPVVIALSPKTGGVLMGRYDGGYPFSRYRHAFNPLGGNPTPEERDAGRGPGDTLRRELCEEIDPAIQFNSDYMSKLKQKDPNTTLAFSEVIREIRDAVMLNPIPAIDLYVSVPNVEGGRPAHDFIYSVFQSFISPAIIELTRTNIEKGNRLLTEGYAGISDLNRLVDGKDPLAHSSALIFDHLYAGGRQEFPCLATGARAVPLGHPRARFQDYVEFSYGPRAFRT